MVLMYGLQMNQTLQCIEIFVHYEQKKLTMHFGPQKKSCI